jgi:anti-sigma B factor antagonist
MTLAGDAGTLVPESQAQSSAAVPAALRPEPPPAVILLPDSIDVFNDRDVQGMLAAAIEARPAVLVADGSRTTFCGCSGVTALILAHRQASAAGVQLRLVATTPGVRRILALTRADSQLDIYPDLAAAVGGRPGPAGAPAGCIRTGSPAGASPTPARRSCREHAMPAHVGHQTHPASGQRDHVEPVTADRRSGRARQAAPGPP